MADRPAFLYSQDNGGNNVRLFSRNDHIDIQGQYVSDG